VVYLACWGQLDARLADGAIPSSLADGDLPVAVEANQVRTVPRSAHVGQNRARAEPGFTVD